MKCNDGEYMPLNWYGTPDAYYIKGHVSHEEGIEILFDAGAIDHDYEVGRASHIYGRWSMQPGEDGNQHFLREYSESGRGRFKITMFVVGPL